MLMRRPMLPNKVSTLGMRWVIWAAFRNNKTESSMNHKTQSVRNFTLQFPLVIQLSKAGRAFVDTTSQNPRIGTADGDGAEPTEEEKHALPG